LVPPDRVALGRPRAPSYTRAVANHRDRGRVVSKDDLISSTSGRRIDGRDGAPPADAYAGLLVGLAALAVPVSFALAGGGKTVTVNIEYHNDDCGESQTKRLAGTATFSRSGDRLTVKAKLKGADPGTYYMSLWDAESIGCVDQIGDYIGKFKPDSTGKKTVSFDVSGTSGRFLFCAYNNDVSHPWNCTVPIVELGPNQLP
jgi:hypothetical protein